MPAPQAAGPERDARQGTRTAPNVATPDPAAAAPEEPRGRGAPPDPRTPLSAPTAARPPLPPRLDWREGPAGLVPVSTRYDDPYYALSDGLAETRHTYLAAAALPARMAGQARFRVGELGFGAGLACLAAWEAWLQARAPGGTLHFDSFELHPIAPEDMARALAAFPALAPLAAQLVAAWAAASSTTAAPPATPRHIRLEGLSLTVHIGDARAVLPRTRLLAGAWFLDGFAPRRNPELWAPELLSAVARRTAPGGTASTYSAAGTVRRALSAAGFAVEKRPGYGRKRDMTLARLRPEGAT